MLQKVHFDVDGMKIFSRKPNAFGKKGIGCNSQGACIVNKNHEMISGSAPGFPIGSPAVLHSLSGNLKKHNGQEVEVLAHDRNKKVPRVQVRVKSSSEKFWTNISYLRYVLHVNQPLKVLSWNQTQHLVASNKATSFVQQNKVGEEMAVTKVGENIAAKNVLLAANLVVDSLRNLKPSRIPMLTFPKSAEPNRNTGTFTPDGVCDGELRAAGFITSTVSSRRQVHASHPQTYASASSPTFGSPTYPNLQPSYNNPHQPVNVPTRPTFTPSGQTAQHPTPPETVTPAVDISANGAEAEQTNQNDVQATAHVADIQSHSEVGVAAEEDQQIAEEVPSSIEEAQEIESSNSIADEEVVDSKKLKIRTAVPYKTTNQNAYRI